MPMADVFLQIRSQYENNGSPRNTYIGPGHNRVLARDPEWFITELPDKWKIDYERRKRHQHTGYFALNHVPYRTFANLKHTDVYDLVGDFLGVSMNRHYAFLHAYNLSNQSPPLYDTTDDSSEPLNTIIVYDGENKKRKCLPPSRNAGLSAICVTLGADSRTMRDVGAGESFKETLRQEEQRGKYLKNMKSAKTVIKGGVEVSVHNPSSFLPPMVHTASSKTCLVGSLSSTPTMTTPLPDSEPDADREHETDGNKSMHNGSVATPSSRRSSRGSTSKAAGTVCKQESSPLSEESQNVESGTVQHTITTVGPNLYVALAAVQFKMNHGSKTKQNKALRIAKNLLKRQCLAKLKSVYAILCCLHNIKTRDLKSRAPLSFVTIKALSQKPLYSINKDHHHIHHFHVDHLHTPPTPMHNRYSSQPHSHSTHHHSTTHHHGPTSTEHNSRCPTTGLRHPTVEGWEDVLQLHNVYDLGIMPATNGGGIGLPRTGSSRDAHTQHKPLRVLPPWQRQVILIDNKDDSLKLEPAQKLRKCIDSFHYFKSEMSQQVKTALTERQQQREKNLTNKLKHLVFGPNRDDCLEEMREKAYKIRRDEREQENNKPEWYVLLEKEVEPVFEDKPQDGVAALEKLKQFLYVESDAIPYVTEKLTLLVMSLPANQLSIDQVFTAIQFVSKHILKISPKLCMQLRDLRKLPPVTTELPDPAYVFGMHV